MTVEETGAEDGGASPGWLSRRRFAGLLAGLAAVASGAVLWALGREAERQPAVPDDWEAAAEQRIREHRTATLEVAVSDADGGAAADLDVAVVQREHAFGFGTAVDAPALVEGSADDAYREHLLELFDTAVLENHHKWRFWEEQREIADGATEWLLDRGFDLRGHTCLWANRDAYAVPADVETALDEDDAEHVEARTLEHVREIVEYYGDDVVEWDVVNEAINQSDFTTLIDPGEPPAEAPILAEWCRTAEEAAPTDVTLAVNEYDVLAGPNESMRTLYEDQIEFLLAEGVDLGGVGLQCHVAADERLSPEELVTGLDRYAELDVPVRVTEFDTHQGSWEGPEEQAAYLHTFLKTVYSHPAVEDFLMWGFWDGAHWGDDAPLFFEDWEPKPAHDVYTDLVFEEWWTDEAGATDEDGRLAVRATLGDHDVSLSLPDGDVAVPVTVERPDEQTVPVVVVEPTAVDEGDVVAVRIDAGEALDPDAIDPETARVGSPASVNDRGGAPAVARRTDGDALILEVDAETDPLREGVAVLRARTEDGTHVAGAVAI